MSTQVSSINSTSSSSSTSSAAATSSVPKLTDDTKKKLQALGVDTTNITTEAQGQIALVQAQAQQQLQQENGDKKHKGGDKAEMEALKSQATSLASKVGVSVSSDEKLSDILAAVGPAIETKAAAAGNDQTKLAEVQQLQSEYATLSTSLSNLQAQHSQGAQSTQGTQALSSSLNTLAAQNKLYHQV